MHCATRWVFHAMVAGLLLPAGVIAQTVGDGVSAIEAKQYVEAVRILSPLADGGNDEAQRLLGELIFNGQGVKKNPAAALAWTRLSAENGNRVAQYNLGYLYEHGAGVAASRTEAIVWYSRSARQEYMLAQRRLGELYESSDLKLARHWYDKARANGDELSLQRSMALNKKIEAIEAPLREAERVLAESEAAEAAARRRAGNRDAADLDDAPSGNRNWAAQGVAEGLGNFQRDSARVSAIHQQSMNNIQAQANERAREERWRAAQQQATRDHGRAEAARVDAQARLDQARVEVQERMRQATVPAEREPLHHWTYRINYTEGTGTRRSQDATDQVARARARQEAHFDQQVAAHASGRPGYASWRAVKVEPVACKNAGTQAQPLHRCNQRVDYAVVSTSPSMGDTVFNVND
ncbi:SEL1-like repeat protein [Hydrogenophaga laconesensis]|uniref:TPR repeat protein n=1 Tax=Hydrogenophaga laconesensis TaxID=1805971 RepID=A0ABU1V959_9BURK|nr:SEL1-like repeat protein [Hydrogenophaga laconesensis]MDR7093999.1 TPR repeat protein [Hydrogenophaga laconesensis]